MLLKLLDVYKRQLLYTEDSYKVLTDALNAAADMLKDGNYTKSQVDSATTSILNAITGLEVKPLDKELLINKEASNNKDGVVVKLSLIHILGITLALFFTIYLAYYALTYISCRRNLDI